MSTEWKTVLIGATGAASVVTLDHVNKIVALAVGLLTLSALVPRLVFSVRAWMRKRKTDTQCTDRSARNDDNDNGNQRETNADRTLNE